MLGRFVHAVDQPGNSTLTAAAVARVESTGINMMHSD